MGMFDNVRIFDGHTESGELVPNNWFICPGCKVNLKDHTFQSKDFGETMGMVEIYPDSVSHSSGAWAISELGAGEFFIYTHCCECAKCDPLNQAFRYQVCWREFKMTLDADCKIVSVKYVSGPAF